MKTDRAFTLMELVVTTSTIVLLAAIAMPSFIYARQEARQVACCAQLHQIATALTTYQAVNRFRFPPFSFSDFNGNIPVSGHWGGPIQKDSTLTFRHPGISPDTNVNLWSLAQGNMLPAQALVCLSAPSALRDGDTSLFAYTNKFSSYCLRFPVSGDLFDESPDLANYNGADLLNVYRTYCSGQEALVSHAGMGATNQTVPALRLNKTYRLVPAVVSAKDTFDPAADAVIADGFWWPDVHQAAPVSKKYRTFPVEGRWSHQSDFNVLFGGGSVHTFRDGGIIRDNSPSAALTLNDDGQYYASYGERIWQFFDTAGK